MHRISVPPLWLSALAVSCAILIGCSSRGPVTAVATPAPDAGAVWQGDVADCRSDAGDVGQCLIARMRVGGASTSALAVAEGLVARGTPGHVSAWREVDGVGHAQITYPFRANTNQVLWLVDAGGHVIDVDGDDPLSATPQAEALRAFLAAHPDAVVFPPARAAGQTALADGGLRLRFELPLRSCHACADLGRLEVGYEFDRERRFTNRTVTGVRTVN